MRNNTNEGVGQENKTNSERMEKLAINYFFFLLLFVFRPDQWKLQFYTRINTASVTDRLVFFVILLMRDTNILLSRNAFNVPATAVF